MDYSYSLIDEQNTKEQKNRQSFDKKIDYMINNIKANIINIKITNKRRVKLKNHK